jgi:mannose-6-phosphate isomerase-like protein (cupin superfamily)
MPDDARTGAEVALEKFDLEALLAPLPPRTNLNVFFVDDRYALRIARVRDTFPAHRHAEGDEGWFVYRGRLRIDTELGPVELSAGQGARIPKGMRHSPTALEEGTLVMVVNVRGMTIDYEHASDAAGAGFLERDLPPATDEGGK